MGRKLIVGLLILVGLLVFQSNQLQAKTIPPGVANQTVPTRTATPNPQPSPEPTDPPDDPPPGNPPPGNPPPPPEATIEATPTDTPVPLPPTPEGGYLATAAPCSPMPTILALNPNFINARSGPGTDYPVLDQLIYFEVRPITGRAGEAAWWQIQLVGGQAGWVADEVVEVHGDISQVPVVAAPALGEVTVTPGVFWLPTPAPECPTAVPTPTIGPLITPTDQQSDSGETIVVSPPETTPAIPTVASYPSPLTEELGETNVMDIAAVTPTPTPTAIVLATTVADTGSQSTEPVEFVSENIPEAEPGIDISGLLLLGAAGLILAGIVAILYVRRPG